MPCIYLLKNGGESSRCSSAQEENKTRFLPLTPCLQNSRLPRGKWLLTDAGSYCLRACCGLQFRKGTKGRKRKKSSVSDLRIPRQDPMMCHLNFLALLLLLVGSPLPLFCKCCAVPEGTVSRRDGAYYKREIDYGNQSGWLSTTHSTPATWSGKCWEKTYLQVIPIEYPCIQIYPCRFLALRLYRGVHIIQWCLKAWLYQEDSALKVSMWITCTF